MGVEALYDMFTSLNVYTMVFGYVELVRVQHMQPHAIYLFIAGCPLSFSISKRFSIQSDILNCPRRFMELHVGLPI
jgi:hypothetical protein